MLLWFNIKNSIKIRKGVFSSNLDMLYQKKVRLVTLGQWGPEHRLCSSPTRTALWMSTLIL